MKRILVLLLLSLLLLSACSQPGKNGNVGLTQGKTAPDFTLRNLNGSDVKLSSYRGKVVVLNFFGVWCPWCVKEMPGFIKVCSEYKEKNVELLVVDVGDTKDKAEQYLDENKFDINITMDSRQEVSRLYNVTGFPTTYIIDENGIIKAVDHGYTSGEQLADTLKTIVK